jgi:DNA-binding HxlR family transcriptional regulator
MANARSYRDRCGVARALDLVGERWAVLIVRDLLLGPKRFTDLQAGLSGLSPDVLTQRLRELAEGGVIRRRKLPPPASSWVYELTDWGRELEPIVTELGRWGTHAPLPDGNTRIGADSVILGMRLLFSRDRAEDLTATYLLRLDGQPFRVHISRGVLEIRREEPEHVDATIDTDPAILEALLWNGRPLGTALGAGELTIAGERALIDQLLTLFPAEMQTPARH